jgi:integrase
VGFVCLFPPVKYQICSRLMRAIDGYQGTLVVRAALFFSAYTFQRPEEIRQAEWIEFDFSEN